MGWKIDEIDRKILEILRENARIPNEKLGKKVGLSEPAARRRVNNLVSRGVVRRFTVDVEEGGAVQALVFINASPTVPSGKVVAEISRIDGVGSILEISGDTDLVVQLHAPDMDSLNARIDQMRKHPEIRGTRTNMIMKKWK
jgi:DNA-binding Lrp family transcriptional regulator